MSADGKTWTLHLVDNATFHDGTPLTSADLKYTLELYRDTDAFPYLSSYPDVFKDIEAPEPTTLTITTSDPVGNFESRMAFIYVLPKHIWEKASDPATFDNAAMIGSGPFKLAEYKQGEFTRLAANTGYWQGRPNVDGVIFQTIQNPDARVTALTNGDVDMITEFPNTAVPTLQNNDNVKVVISDPLSGDLRDLILNVTDPANCPKDDPATTDTDESGVCSGHPALRDRAVRQALAEATDKQQLIDVALVGLGTPGLTLVPPGLGDFYANEIDPTPFNVADANRLLDEAGYKDTDGNGIRNCKAGQDCPTGDLTFRFNYPSDIDTAGREAELISQMWSQIGVSHRPDLARLRHADERLLPGVRLRRHPVALGVGSRSGVPARRRAVLRDHDRLLGDRLLQPAVRRALCAAGHRDRSRHAGRPDPPDAADPDDRPAVHHPVLREDGAGVPDGPLQRLAGRAEVDRPRGSELLTVVRPVSH